MFASEKLKLASSPYATQDIYVVLIYEARAIHL